MSKVHRRARAIRRLCEGRCSRLGERTVESFFMRKSAGPTRESNSAGSDMIGAGIPTVGQRNVLAVALGPSVNDRHSAS